MVLELLEVVLELLELVLGLLELVLELLELVLSLSLSYLNVFLVSAVGACGSFGKQKLHRSPTRALQELYLPIGVLDLEN